MRVALSPTPAAEVASVDVSVVIVTYNVREFLEQALESVQRASGGLNVETWVVDNDSADGSVEMVRARFPDVRVIANQENVGFATANNQALRQAAGRYALVLNPDTILQEDTLRELVGFMDAHPDTGAAGCRILNPDGTFAPESRRAFPTPAVAFFRLTGLSRLFPNSPTFGRYNLTYLPQDEVCEIDALSGSCMMVRREAILGEEGWGKREKVLPEASGEDEATHPASGDGALPEASASAQAPKPSPRHAAGLFDEAFFMYGEDLDWCYRIQQAGWKIRYTPATQIVHYKGESTKKGDLRYVRLFYGAMLRFVEKHLTGGGHSALGRAGSRLLALGIRAGIVGRASLAALSQVGRALAAPATDTALGWIALSLAALLWSLPRGFSFDADMYAVVLPLYALALVLGVGGAGGYGRRQRRIRPVVIGAGVGFLAVATVSFLIPLAAFSRATVLTGFALGTVLLVARRLLARRETRGPRRALVVGSGAEAERLRRLAQGRLHLDIVGYVGDRDAPASGARGTTSQASGVPHAGPARQLRDLGAPARCQRSRLRRRRAHQHRHSLRDARLGRPAGRAQDPGAAPRPHHRQGERGRPLGTARKRRARRGATEVASGAARGRASGRAGGYRAAPTPAASGEARTCAQLAPSRRALHRPDAQRSPRPSRACGLRSCGHTPARGVGPAPRRGLHSGHARRAARHHRRGAPRVLGLCPQPVLRARSRHPPQGARAPLVTRPL